MYLGLDKHTSHLVDGEQLIFHSVPFKSVTFMCTVSYIVACANT